MKAYSTLSLLTQVKIMIRIKIISVKPKCIACRSRLRLSSFSSNFRMSTQKDVVSPVREESADE